MTRAVEFNKVALNAALRNGLDLNDANLSDLKPLTQEEATKVIDESRDEIVKEVELQSSTMNLSALGAKYQLGPLSIDNVLGNLVLLTEIESPLVTDDNLTEISYDDVVKAIYVLAKGRDVLKPLMEISQRIQDLLLLKDACKGNPELIEKIVDKAEDISNARIRFLEDARAFYDKEFVGYDFEEMINSVMNVVIDSVKAAGDNPATADKKKVD